MLMKDCYPVSILSEAITIACQINPDILSQEVTSYHGEGKWMFRDRFRLRVYVVASTDNMSLQKAQVSEASMVDQVIGIRWSSIFNVESIARVKRYMCDKSNNYNPQNHLPPSLALSELVRNRGWKYRSKVQSVAITHAHEGLLSCIYSERDV
ncbi:hypothetical protein MKW98_032269 [Papaver atlanticum]|uniref:Uncharacterized protein n=1 Tax=Papaver atlanticum TaxID=357466 RepID=A0AAD4XCL4_9MAGN|nr:hypothetical protein MKW98_032269 [Papaver atlanticum]